ncbi:MAG: ferrous iron transport protein B [Bacteroidales bacterium]
MTLDQLTQGQKAVILKIKGRGAFRHRIIEMGFVKGQEVSVLRFAPMKDPVEFRILGSEISLRRSEAALIEINLLSSTENAISNSVDCLTDKEESSFEKEGAESQEEPSPNFKRNGYKSPFSIFSQKISTSQKVSASKKTSDILSAAVTAATTQNSSSTSLPFPVIEVCMVGNPNAGKTSLYNALSGEFEHVGNYSGVTVDAKTVRFPYQDYIIELTDLPGSYSFSPYSPEESFVRDQLLNKKPDVIINVVDASNLERNLYLTTQLIDMDFKVVIALNMYDEFTKKGDLLDYELLGKLMGMPVIPTIASKRKGIHELLTVVTEVFNEKNPTIRHTHIPYLEEVENSLRKIQDKIWKDPKFVDIYSSRFLAIKLLEKDVQVVQKLDCLQEVEPILQIAKLEGERLQMLYKEDADHLMAEFRYAFIRGALKECYKPAGTWGASTSSKEKNSTSPITTKQSVTDRIDSILIHKIWGFPIFLIFLWIMFQTTFLLGSYPVEWIDMGVGKLSSYLHVVMYDSMLKDVLLDGILRGIGGVIIFLPNILILFSFIAFMEATGYMARVAFIMDKLMHTIGLHGKSFIPLIIGFGCNVPAVMATRTIENRKDRILTMLIVPFMSCSARLPIYILLVGAFFQAYAGTVIFLIYIVGIIFSILSALLFRFTLLPSTESPFVMEMPPYRWPTTRSVFRNLWVKTTQYLRKMGGIILIASILIWALGYFPIHPQPIAPEVQLEQSYLGTIGKWMEPIIKPLGFDWKMGISLLAGISAKEVVVSTMSVMMDAETAFTPLTAISFLAFVLLYFPCIAVFAAVHKESGSWKWPIFMALYTISLAWLVSFLIFQIGSFL